MSFGNLIGQILQQGMAGQSRERLQHSMGAQGLGAMPGLADVLGAVLQGQGGGRAGGGLGDVLGGMLGKPSAARAGGGLGDLLGSVLGGAAGQGAAKGGLGDLLGGMLGGGQNAQRGGGNALGGAGMAILASLAMAALKNWNGQRAPAAGLVGGAAAPTQAELAALTAPETERLVLRAMLSAAKADGTVDEAEIQRIVGKIDDDGVSAEEKQFLLTELRKPLDLQGLIRDVPGVEVAAQVYGASLLAIDVDTPAEVDYLRRLAAGLGLDAATVARLHQLTGAPTI
ncbi:tellurite resistance TerB family protein [Pseudothauera nasutitermitis]|uniref:Tellurite resistance TerB family protein n=1 Tax=Pseudothauera nasutitermitis TaxID=2565930 RepID=A0A4S4AQ57_9RHOO|nr:tellurite resistance TerB family protein [Pseudothauera nasutitermitis]THF61793.1 tellurite resistance TerB family protein [Pseudothauera nasutitermitis]